jgi:hypothetical protein
MTPSLHSQKNSFVQTFTTQDTYEDDTMPHCTYVFRFTSHAGHCHHWHYFHRCLRLRPHLHSYLFETKTRNSLPTHCGCFLAQLVTIYSHSCYSYPLRSSLHLLEYLRVTDRVERVRAQRVVDYCVERLTARGSWQARRRLQKRSGQVCACSSRDA